MDFKIHHLSFIIPHYLEFGAKIHFLSTSETKVQQKPILCRLIFNDRMADIRVEGLPFVVKHRFLSFILRGPYLMIIPPLMFKPNGRPIRE
jgi:hypothetical protein